MPNGTHDRRQNAKAGEGQHRGVEQQAEQKKILIDRAGSDFAQPQQKRQRGQAVLHEHDIGGFQRHRVLARRDADSDSRSCQSRPVVRSVAHVADVPAASAEHLKVLILLLRQQLGEDAMRRNAEVLSHSMGNCLCSRR